MPIINLTVDGKQAINDTGNIKIVCMNSDYKVRFTFKNCDDLLELPYKKLVVKYDMECKESPIEEVTVDDETVWQADLPVIENQTRVELGVCGRDNDKLDANTLYTSKSAWFDCEKSVLDGAVVLKTAPELIPLEVTANGEYHPYSYEADGFSEVSVNIPETVRESRNVALFMAGGSQEILPSKPGIVMSKVTVTKPLTLTPENIVKGVDIGGVKGSYEVRVMTKEIFADGEYTPPEGYGGFSKVVVKVGSSNFATTVYVGDSFTYDYAHDVKITVETDDPDRITYAVGGDVVTFTAHKVGKCGIHIVDFDEDGAVLKDVYYSVAVQIKEDEALPVVAYTAGEMQEYLNKGRLGAVVRYLGPTSDGFVNDSLYLVQEAK